MTTSKVGAVKGSGVKRGAPASLRFCLLVLISGAFMGWAVVVVAAYYMVRSNENPWLPREMISTLGSASPARLGDVPGSVSAGAPDNRADTRTATR
jgi:hypothetical protein